MRFMMIVKASAQSEAGGMPPEDLLEAMSRFNEEMHRAGAMLDGAGLQPSSRGARVVIEGGRRNVVHGPFPATQELIAGYWMIQANSLQEAIEWAMRVPAPHGEGVDTNIEIRPLFEIDDFGDNPATERERAIERELQARRGEEKR